MDEASQVVQERGGELENRDLLGRILFLSEGVQILFVSFGLVFPLILFFWRTQFWRAIFQGVLSRPVVLQSLLNSLLLSLGAASLSVTLGFVLSWLLWRYQWREGTKKWLSLLLRIPYALPPFFLAMGWMVLAAPNVGYLNRLLRSFNPEVQGVSIYGLGGAVFVLVLWCTALCMIQFQSFFSQVSGALEDAALLSGASPFQAFFRITLPLARPHLLSSSLLVVVNCLSAFGVPALLMTPIRQTVLTTRIFQSLKGGSGDFSEAALLSILLLTLTLLLLMFQRRLLNWAGERGSDGGLVTGKPLRPAALQPRWGAKLGLLGGMGIALLGTALPLLALLWSSLLLDPTDLFSLSFQRYRMLFSDVPEALLALRNSLGAAVAATLLVTTLALFTAYGAVKQGRWISRLLSELWNLGYALPGTVIALALLVFFAGTLTDTLWILVIAFSVKYAAFSLKTLVPAFGGLSKELEEAGWMSGASPAKTFFSILVPLLRTTLFSAGVLAFLPMVSELTMSILLAGVGTETLGTLIYRFLDYGDSGAASALAVLLMMATLGLNGWVRRVSNGRLGL